MTDIMIATFDYGAVDADIASKLRRQAERIRSRLRKHTEDIIETGRDIAAVKDKIEHGLFVAWIESELKMATRTAQAFMSAARLADETKSATIALFPPATVYRLAAKSTPPEIKDTILQRAASGDIASDREVKGLIDDAAWRRQVEKENAAKVERRARQRQESARTKARREQEEREATERARLIQARADAAVALIVRNLDAGARAELLELINGVFHYSTPRLLHEGLLAELPAPTAPPVADAINVPETLS